MTEIVTCNENGSENVTWLSCCENGNKSTTLSDFYHRVSVALALEPPALTKSSSYVLLQQ